MTPACSSCPHFQRHGRCTCVDPRSIKGRPSLLELALCGVLYAIAFMLGRRI